MDKDTIFSSPNDDTNKEKQYFFFSAYYTIDGNIQHIKNFGATGAEFPTLKKLATIVKMDHPNHKITRIVILSVSPLTADQYKKLWSEQADE